MDGAVPARTRTPRCFRPIDPKAQRSWMELLSLSGGGALGCGIERHSADDSVRLGMTRLWLGGRLLGDESHHADARRARDAERVAHDLILESLVGPDVQHVIVFPARGGGAQRRVQRVNGDVDAVQVMTTIAVDREGPIAGLLRACPDTMRVRREALVTAALIQNEFRVMIRGR